MGKDQQRPVEDWEIEARLHGWTPPEDKEYVEKHNGFTKFVWIVIIVILAAAWINGSRTADEVNRTVSSATEPNTKATVATAPPGSAKEAVQNGILTMAEIEERADAIGWSTDAWQEWYYIASKTGMSMDSIEEAAANINKQLADRTPEFLASLDEIGISEEDANAMKPEELFDKVITCLQNMEG